MIQQPGQLGQSKQVENSNMYGSSLISANSVTSPIKIKKWANEFFSILYHLPMTLAQKLSFKSSSLSEEWEVKEDRDLGMLAGNINLLKISLDEGKSILPSALSKLKQNIANVKELITKSVDSEFIQAQKETFEILEKKFEILNKQAEFRAIPKDITSLKTSLLKDQTSLENSLVNPSITALLKLKQEMSANSIQKLQVYVCGHNKIGADLQPILNKKSEHLSAGDLETLAKYLPPDAAKEVFKLAKALVTLQKKSLNHVDELVSTVKNSSPDQQMLSTILDEIQALRELKASLTYKISGKILFFTNDKENMQKILDSKINKLENLLVDTGIPSVDAQVRIRQVMSAQTEMLNALQAQYKVLSDSEKLEPIYKEAILKIDLLGEKLIDTFKNKKNLSKEDLKDLKKSLHQLEEQGVEVIHQSQLEIVAQLGASKIKDPQVNDLAAVQEAIKLLAQNGLKAKWIRFSSSIFKTHRVAIHAFQEAQKEMVEASKISIDNETTLNYIQKDIQNEFNQYVDRNDLKNRAGVFHINGKTRIVTTFDKKAISKQVKSLRGQLLSNVARTIIKKDLKIGETNVTSKQIPLNTYFDNYIKEKSDQNSTFFGDLFGDKGVASANREETHLTNGWLSTLETNERTLAQVFKHAIIANKFEKDPSIRKEKADQIAKELLHGVIALEIAGRPELFNEKDEKRDEVLLINLNSTSLVTPDDMRHLPFMDGITSEKQLLRDQIAALKNLEKTTFITLNGRSLKVEVKVNAFNFGVNQGAVGRFKVKGIPIENRSLRMGLSEQYKYNIEALKGLQKQHQAFVEKLSNDPKLVDSTKSLMNDINILLKDEHAYLEGNNQYEVGAKILLLTNIMNQALVAKKEKVAISGAFNCASGKDRTGMMDGILKTFALMTDKRGKCPTHQEFIAEGEAGEILRKEFTSILVPLLLESGVLEITYLNTGAKGLKISEEARLFNMPLEDFLQMQGLSTTSSY